MQHGVARKTERGEARERPKEAGVEVRSVPKGQHQCLQCGELPVSTQGGLPPYRPERVASQQQHFQVVHLRQLGHSQDADDVGPESASLGIKTSGARACVCACVCLSERECE